MGMRMIKALSIPSGTTAWAKVRKAGFAGSAGAATGRTIRRIPSAGIFTGSLAMRLDSSKETTSVPVITFTGFSTPSGMLV